MYAEFNVFNVAAGALVVGIIVGVILFKYFGGYDDDDG